MLTKSQLIVIGVVGLVVVVFALVFTGVIPGLQTKKPTSIGGQVNVPKTFLEFWGIFDKQEDYQTAFNGFQTANPGLEIHYTKFDNEKDYFDAILEALASGKGPDLIMIPSNGLQKHLNRLQPAPTTAININVLRQMFPQVVEQDFVSGGNIYGLPLSLDTLALFYNRDVFDQAAINAPSTWEDFKKATIKLTELTAGKTIVKSGAAIGGTRKSIHSAPDILMLLMMQNGTTMINQQNQASFASMQGENALNFYTQFSNQKSDAYTWDDGFEYSLDAFAKEKIPMIIDYASAIPEIKARNQFLNFAVAPAPQPQGAQKTVAYPNYWGYAVTKQSRNQNLAWQFIIQLTTQQAENYLKVVKKPPALRSLIAKNLNDLDLGVFAKQALIARSWTQADSEAVKTIFDQMIGVVLENKATIKSALEQGQARINALK